MRSLEKNSLLGQVWTPDDVAEEMVNYVLKHLPNNPVILDPACGPATFPISLWNKLSNNFTIQGFDIDKRMSGFTKEILRKKEIPGRVVCQDYLLSEQITDKYDLVILNPPYIRHEKIDADVKSLYNIQSSELIGETIDGRANLLAHFIVRAFSELKDDGIMCAIVYDAILHTKYGAQVYQFLLKNATLLERVAVKTPFDNVAIDASILVFRRNSSNKKATLRNTKLKKGEARLDQLLQIRRGTSFPKREFFIPTKNHIYFSDATPILLKPGSVSDLYATADSRAFLVNNNKSEKWLSALELSLKQNGYEHAKSEIKPISGKIFFNYFIRKNPRHLWSGKKMACSDNFYVSEATCGIPDSVAWLFLNSTFFLNRIEKAGRTQGGGLTKLQLFEYRGAVVPDWRLLSSEILMDLDLLTKKLIKARSHQDEIKKHADYAVSLLRHRS